MSKGSIVAVVVVVLVGSGVYLAYRSLVELGYEPCVLSIEDGIAMQMSAPEFREIPLSQEWRTLTEDEEILLFDKFKAAGRRFDCKNFGKYANGDVLIGENGTIKVRKVDRHVRVRVEINDGRIRKYS